MQRLSLWACGKKINRCSARVAEWQTHSTQNRAGDHEGSTPSSGTITERTNGCIYILFLAIISAILAFVSFLAFIAATFDWAPWWASLWLLITAAFGTLFAVLVNQIHM